MREWVAESTDLSTLGQAAFTSGNYVDGSREADRRSGLSRVDSFRIQLLRGLEHVNSELSGDTLTLNLKIWLPLGGNYLHAMVTDYSGFNSALSYMGYQSVVP